MPKNTNSAALMNGITPDDVSKWLNELIGTSEDWSKLLLKIYQNKNFTDEEWLTILRAILSSIEKNLVQADPMRPLIKVCRDVIADGLLNGSDLIVIGVALATNYQAPPWLYDIAEKALSGKLVGSDFEGLVQQFVGADNAVLFDELLNQGTISSKTLLAALSIVLYRLGLLDNTSASFTLDSNQIYALLKAGIMKLVHSSNASNVENHVADFLDGLHDKVYGKALLGALGMMGVNSVPDFVKELLTGTALRTVALNELRDWINKQNPGGVANGAIAEELLKLIEGSSDLFKQSSDIEEWTKAYPKMVYWRVLAIRRILFYTKVLSTSGGVIPTARDASPVLIGLWIKPGTKIADVLPKKDDQNIFRILVACEFSRTFGRPSGPNGFPYDPPNVDSKTTLASFCEKVNDTIRASYN